MKQFKVTRNKEFLLKRMGHLSQLAGIKRYELISGRSKGVEAVDIKTGTGFSYTVLPGRGMDIAWADFRGIPVGYISKTGIVSPEYYESDDLNWLRNFYAGLLTTCGLLNVGIPCEEDHAVIGIRRHGLHGRISNIPADNVCINEEWDKDDFIMSISGSVKESIFHGENLQLHRKITSRLGENKIIINDTIENLGFNKQLIMILYHINIGYPLLDENSQFICNSKRVEPANELAKKNIKKFNTFQEPTKGYKENLYFHSLNNDRERITYAGVINEKLELGVYIKFNRLQLPRFTEWKILSESEYVFGMEPGNCLPLGRRTQENEKSLEYLDSGSIKNIDIEIGILSDKEQIDNFKIKVEKINQ